MARAQGESDGKPTNDMSTADERKGLADQETSDEVAEAGQKPIDEIESLCMNCHENVCAA